MTTREAFGAEFVGAEGFLNSPTYGLPPGFLIDEIKLQGVIRTKQQGLIGMIDGPDNRSYLLKIGDKVLDGEVIRITPSSVVFRQEVNDPTRIERFREVVKDLSPETQKK